MNRIDFLDGYRGLLALSVIFIHTGWEMWLTHGFYFGVIGFFLLSSFLLTYRLIKQYEKAAKHRRKLVTLTISYLITRFFRIYAPYVIFCFIQDILFVKFELFMGTRNQSWVWYMDLPFYLKLTQISSFTSHLWTMPIEIRYYFCIPIIAFVASKIKNTWLIVLLNMSTVIFLLFAKTNNLMRNSEPAFSPFVLFFPVFFAGSLLAINYKILEEININNKIKSFKLLDFFVNWLSIFIFIVGLRAYAWFFPTEDSTYFLSLYWSILILLMLIGSPNSLTSFLENSSFLQLYGKFSFGIYLFHILAIELCSRSYWDIMQDTDVLMAIIFLSLILGYLFFHLVENPMMKIGKILSECIITRIEVKENDLVLSN